jgi:hypothetical protein
MKKISFCRKCKKPKEEIYDPTFSSNVKICECELEHQNELEDAQEEWGGNYPDRI